jgi:hypothetical protein
MHCIMRYRLFTMLIVGHLVFTVTGHSAVAFFELDQIQSTIHTKRVPLIDISLRNRKTITKQRSLQFFNVSLNATLIANGPSVSRGITWHVYEDGTKDKSAVWSGAGAPRLRLLPGRYRVEAKYGLARASELIEVHKGTQTAATLVLNAGTLRVTGVAVAGGRTLPDVSFNLRGSEPDLRELNLPGQAETVFHVPAGTYNLFARQGFAHTAVPVTIKAGDDVSTEVVMNTAVLTLSAHAARGSAPLGNATFTVYEDTDVSQRREIARSTLAAPRLVLPAGAYRVVIAAGGVREERQIVLGSGEEKSETFDLAIGGVHLSAISMGNRQPLEKSLQYRIFSLSKDASPNQPLFSTPGTSSAIFLKKGRYRIEGQYGWHNVRQVREVEVSAGSTVNVTFEFSACNVTLKLLNKTGTPVTDVKWTLKYRDGGTVLISQDAIPKLILQAGNYQAMAVHQTKIFSRSFEAVAGSGQTIELIAE